MRSNTLLLMNKETLSCMSIHLKMPAWRTWKQYFLAEGHFIYNDMELGWNRHINWSGKYPHPTQNDTLRYCVHYHPVLLSSHTCTDSVVIFVPDLRLKYFCTSIEEESSLAKFTRSKVILCHFEYVLSQACLK